MAQAPFTTSVCLSKPLREPRAVPGLGRKPPWPAWGYGQHLSPPGVWRQIQVCLISSGSTIWNLTWVRPGPYSHRTPLCVGHGSVSLLFAGPSWEVLGAPPGRTRAIIGSMLSVPQTALSLVWGPVTQVLLCEFAFSLPTVPGPRGTPAIGYRMPVRFVALHPIFLLSVSRSPRSHMCHWPG